MIYLEAKRVDRYVDAWMGGERARKGRKRVTGFGAVDAEWTTVGGCRTARAKDAGD